MKTIFSLIFLIASSASLCQTAEGKGSLITHGQMPNLATDAGSRLHLAYGSGDSIFYSVSNDRGRSFSSAILVATLPKLYSYAMRGPQIAATRQGPCIIACDQKGNIYSYIRDQKGSWKRTCRINDQENTAPEGMMALGTDGRNLFAIWLDLRTNRHNNIYLARSPDGGRSWTKNQLLYLSPDGNVCECCKPSIAVNGKNISIMFRNWVGGHRDLYVVRSFNGGKTFEKAQKLGMGSWKLSGCPMDGGGLAMNDRGATQTVWRREGKIYACTPGQAEQELGEGRNPSVAILNGKNVYAWVEKGEVVVLLPGGIKKTLGKGSLPLLKTTDNSHVLCLWENDKQIQKELVGL